MIPLKKRLITSRLKNPVVIMSDSFNFDSVAWPPLTASSSNKSSERVADSEVAVAKIHLPVDALVDSAADEADKDKDDETCPGDRHNEEVSVSGEACSHRLAEQ